MNAWGVPTQGAWAAQVDEEEQANGGTLDAPKEPVITFGQDKAFPTLGEAVKKKESKKDKKKPQKMNLADFQSNYKPPTASRRPTVSDDQIKASLPTAPRARDSDEPSAGLGGAFRDYGGGDRGDGERPRDRGSFFGRRDRDGDSQDGSEAFGDEPSRADAVDDWGATRKFVPSSSDRSSGGFGSGGFGSRREEKGEPGEAGPSRADTVDDWGASRKFTPSSTGSGGFEDRASSRGFGSSRRTDDDLDGGPSRADTESRWGKKIAPSSGVSSGSSGGGFEDRPSRDRDVDEPWGARRAPTDAPEAAPSGGRPRLKLAPRTKPLPVLDIPPEAKLPEKKEPEPESLPVPTGPPKPKPNPFGAARPREEVLKEQGRDWKKEELALETKDITTDRWTDKASGTEDIREGLEKLPKEVASEQVASEPVNEETEHIKASTPQDSGAPNSVELISADERAAEKAAEQKAQEAGTEATT